MPAYLWVVLVVASGLLCLPVLAAMDYLLHETSAMKVAAKQALEYSQFNEVARLQTKLRMLRILQLAMLPLCICCVPAIIVTAFTMGPAFDLMGLKLPEVMKENPDFTRLLMPVLPFVGPFMLVTALLIRIFYTPVTKMKKSNLVSAR